MYPGSRYTTRVILPDLSANRVPFLHDRRASPLKLGPAVSTRVAQDAVVPVCKCVWTSFLGVCDGTLNLEILSPTFLRNHILREASFDSLVSSSNKLRWVFLRQNPWTWCHKYIFYAISGVRRGQFDFSGISKLFPMWSDSSSVPTGQLSDGFEDAKCQDLSQLIQAVCY